MYHLAIVPSIENVLGVFQEGLIVTVAPHMKAMDLALRVAPIGDATLQKLKNTRNSARLQGLEPNMK